MKLVLRAPLTLTRPDPGLEPDLAARHAFLQACDDLTDQIGREPARLLVGQAWHALMVERVRCQ